MRELISLFAIGFSLYAIWHISRGDRARIGVNIRTVNAEIYGHRSEPDGGFLALYRFRDEKGEHRVKSLFNSASRAPAVGTIVELTYPEGKPELARPRDLWPRLTAYFSALVFLLIGSSGLFL